MTATAPLVSERLCGQLQQAITALSWSADGEFLAIASAGGELLLLDFRAGCEELLRGDRDSSLNAIGFSADGQFLMAVGQASELLLWELGETDVPPMALEPIPLDAGWLDAAAWQPRGLLLAVAAGRQVRLWDGRQRQWHPQALDLPGSVQALSWSADGTQLAASCHGELALWCPLDPAGHGPPAGPHGLGWPGPGLFAHRWASGLWPDGSLAAALARGGPWPTLAVQWVPREGAGPGLERSAWSTGTRLGGGLRRHRGAVATAQSEPAGLEA